MDAASRTNLDDDLGFLLARLGTTTRLRLAETVAPLDLTLRQFVVMRSIDANEGLSQAQLGERLRIDASSIVQVLDDCQKAGLAERRPSPADRRRYAVHLTKEGKQHLAIAQKAVKAVQDELFAALDDSQRAQLLELLLTLAASGPLSSLAASPNTPSLTGLPQ
ncbi:MAG: MarR family transcriptional regulator [Actinomycetota bacterium]